ncbi:DUF2306 domain-containing protein [Photobacterium japonica]|uniref:DUF2306 domain-containing protein n=1 Tax=Photobacterium japonica TaxID=2910235 RepID=UPI003D0A8E08
MDFFYQSPLGAIHSLCALIAFISGFIVLRNTKGTLFHKKIGYVYGISMILLNLSAIPITNLFNGMGFFHLFILMSLPTVLVGLYLPIFGRHHTNWLNNHFDCMCYSYIGLITAAFAEIIIRMPLTRVVDSMTQYVIAVFVISGLIGLVGCLFINRYKVKIQRRDNN